jgi:hypothetical protein
MDKELLHKWFHRGVEHGRNAVLEGLLNALGLDTNEFKPMPVSEIETEKWFDHFRTMDVLRESAKQKQLSALESTNQFSKHKFTIVFSSLSTEETVTAQCQELGISTTGNSKEEAFDNLRIKINAHLKEKNDQVELAKHSCICNPRSRLKPGETCQVCGGNE